MMKIEEWLKQIDHMVGITFYSRKYMDEYYQKLINIANKLNKHPYLIQSVQTSHNLEISSLAIVSNLIWIENPHEPNMLSTLVCILPFARYEYIAPGKPKLYVNTSDKRKIKEAVEKAINEQQVVVFQSISI